MQTNYVKKQRRNFLKVLFGSVASISLFSFSRKIPEITESKKIKMLTPEGKLVEIDEEVYNQLVGTQSRASNKEVQDWMKTSKT